MARAGPELQAKLLKGLGLKGFMMMNSKNPINLFSLIDLCTRLELELAHIQHCPCS